MLSFQISFTGLDDAIKKFSEVKSVFEDLSPEYEIVGRYLIDFFENDVWESEGDVIGERWADLSDIYALWKGKNYPGRGILELTGTLRHAFYYTSTKDYLLFANPTEYGPSLQYGTATMPPRVFMKLDQERLDAVRGMIIESLQTRVGDTIYYG